MRKAIMDESIYTMKLLARHHTVPEGLHAAILTTERIVDLMDTNFEVGLPGSDITTAAAVVVQDSKGQIVSVSTSSSENAGNPSVADLKFIVVPAKTTPLAALASLCETGADVILVTKKADSGLAADIVGLLTPAILADLLRADDILS